MTTLSALLMILSGVAILGFGIFIFYAFLPLLYALVGFDAGVMLGTWLTGSVGWTAIICGVVGAVILAVASYALEPYRRILIGVSSGIMIGLALATILGLEDTIGSLLAAVLAVVLGLAGGSVVPRIFDILIVFSSGVGGAAMIMNGAHHLIPSLGILDRSSGRVGPALVTAVIAVAGIIWQMSNITKWVAAVTRT